MFVFTEINRSGLKDSSFNEQLLLAALKTSVRDTQRKRRSPHNTRHMKPPLIFHIYCLKMNTYSVINKFTHLIGWHSLKKESIICLMLKRVCFRRFWWWSEACGGYVGFEYEVRYLEDRNAETSGKSPLWNVLKLEINSISWKITCCPWRDCV